MPEDLTKLDPAALSAFADHDVEGFHKDLRDMRVSTPDRRSLYDIAGAPQPARLGAMAEDGDTAGKSVVGNLAKAAGAVDAVFNAHISAFADLKRNLHDVVTSMTKAQQHNLSQVDAQKFLTAISAYVGDLRGGNGSGGTGSGSGSGSGTG